MGKFQMVQTDCRGSPRLVLGPLFFSVYVNDLVENISADVRLFADDTFLFTIVYNESVAADQLNRDLETIPDWTYLWKIHFCLDKTNVQVILSQNK